MLLASLLALMSTTAAIDDCPYPCTAAASEATTGSIPVGVTLFVVPGVPMDGTALNQECTTHCTPCLGLISIQFQPNGEPVCMTLDMNGAGPSQPFVKYIRTGYLIANCDSAFCVNINLTTCHNPVTGLGYTALYCMNCGCG